MPSDFLLLCDIDRREHVPSLRRRVRAVCKLVWPGSCVRITVQNSPSGRGLHVLGLVKTSSPHTDEQVILAQLLCGSDVNRERFNLQRVRQGIREWNVLFETVRYPLSF
jgi:hypothetical protein